MFAVACGAFNAPRHRARGCSRPVQTGDAGWRVMIVGELENRLRR